MCFRIAWPFTAQTGTRGNLIPTPNSVGRAIRNSDVRKETPKGETLVGFISWSSDSSEDSIDYVFINGEHFWNRND
jgi:hypothetical protein